MGASSATEINATGVVLRAPGRLFGIVCLDGTTPSCRLFDNNAAASGEEIYPAAVKTIGDVVSFPGGIPLANGLHATIAGTATPRFLLLVGGP